MATIKYTLYFANSPFGGGLVRALHTVRNLTDKNSIFVISSKAASHFNSHDSRIKVVSVSPLRRLIDENYLLRDLDLANTVVFSHGAAIAPQCKALILHICNALPFVHNQVTLDLKLKLKMMVMKHRLHQVAKVAQVITVESESTRDLVAQSWGVQIAEKCRVLTNGVDFIPESELPPPLLEGPYVVTIGAYPFKRIDRVVAVFRDLVKQQPELKLIIIGTGTDIEGVADGQIYRFANTSYLQTRATIAHCEAFISMSEIENCSISLLEAIHHRRRIYCSQIPSHQEFLRKHGYRYRLIQPNVLEALPPSESEAQTPVPTWNEIAAETLRILQDAGT